jgi:hypothetical protein
VKSIVGFPGFLLGRSFNVLLAFLNDWETFILFTGAALLAYETGEYLIVVGALLVIYSLLRVFGDIMNNLAQATSLYGRVIRDNPPREQPVAITQVPAVLTGPLPEPTEDEPASESA